MRGRVCKNPYGHYRYDKKVSHDEFIPCLVQVHLLTVSTLKDDFPEKGQRQIRWFSPEEASGLVIEPENQTTAFKAATAVTHTIEDDMDIELLKKTPDLRAIADIRLATLEDGPARGQRLLIARNATGIAFEVALDRGFDISSLSFRGTNIGWNSPTQMRFPMVDPGSEGGWAFMRNFDGFLVTCGLDHISRPLEVDIAHYNHPHLKTKSMPQHGRISTEKARLVGYDVDPESGEIFCEGIVRQASVFGENLEPETEDHFTSLWSGAAD